jgi:PiT family inorganic phosphate transporter
MLTVVIAMACVLALAYANGANDNFKGVATLFGSGVSDYRKALWWGTAATFAGSIAAICCTYQLVQVVSGKLFVSPETLGTMGFALAVCGAAGGTVLLATRLGFPISTTHALAGALLGAGTMAAPDAVNWPKAIQVIFVPLGVSPFLAAALSAFVFYPLFHRLRLRFKVERETCVCVGNELVPLAQNTAVLGIGLSVASAAECRQRYTGQVVGLSAAKTVDALHYLSAGAVSFARGLNDTPKLVAFALMAAPLWDGAPTFILIGVLIATGGLLGARRVAETMAHGITAINPGQGFTANLVTAGLVLAASPFGLPVSTTHVSCGALFGVGAVTGQAHWRMIAGIVAAWLVTLPVAAALGASLMLGTRFL